jgi:hypothetical protein
MEECSSNQFCLVLRKLLCTSLVAVLSVAPKLLNAQSSRSCVPSARAVIALEQISYDLAAGDKVFVDLTISNSTHHSISSTELRNSSVLQVNGDDLAESRYFFANGFGDPDSDATFPPGWSSSLRFCATRAFPHKGSFDLVWKSRYFVTDPVTIHVVSAPENVSRAFDGLTNTVVMHSCRGWTYRNYIRYLAYRADIPLCLASNTLFESGTKKPRVLDFDTTAESVSITNLLWRALENGQAIGVISNGILFVRQRE